MDDRPVDQSYRWRPRFRLSVRVLMMLVLVLGGGFGWLVHRVRVQREAVAAIKRAGGSVSYDDAFLGESGLNAPPASGWKHWLVNHLGIDYFETATNVHFFRDGGVTMYDNGPPTGKSLMIRRMAEVGSFPGLVMLAFFMESQVTDAGLAHLRGLSQLRTLVLPWTKIQGPGLANLRGMRQLEDLSLAGIELSDADLAHLAGLTGLHHLSFPAPGSPTPGWPILKD